jgi:choline-sulfatase
MMYYQEEAAVPLIVSFKGVIPAGRNDREHLVSVLDVLPTICDYTGVRGATVMRGQSLRGSIENPKQPGHEYVVSEMANGPARSFMLRTRQYKYMSFPATGSRKSEMFFDLSADPGEMKNVVGQAALATQLERQRTLLAEWNKLTGQADHPMQPTPKAQRKKAQKKKG